VLLVVGGQGRGAGKTAVIAGLIRATPEAAWTAVKLSAHAHGAAPGAGFKLTVQPAADETDAGRYLRAGARRAYLAAAAPEELRDAVAALRALPEWGGDWIIESNRVLEWLEPDLYLAVFNQALAEVKPSCLRFLPRADGLVLVGGEAAPAWRDLLPAGVPRFPVQPPGYASGALAEFVRGRRAHKREAAWFR